MPQLNRINYEQLNFESGFDEEPFGNTSEVYRVKLNNRIVAYKEYQFDDDDVALKTEAYLGKLFNNIGVEHFQELLEKGAFPKALVYKDNRFVGFVMDWAPEACYFYDEKSGKQVEFTLNVLLSILSRGDGEKSITLNDKSLRFFTEMLIDYVYSFHRLNFILGDALSENNIFIYLHDKSKGIIMPYFIDIDSFRISGMNHPFKTYNSPLYYPPEGKYAVSTKKTDIYKLCLIILRLFIIGDKRALVREADEKTLSRIQKVFGTKLRSLVENGLSDNPDERPNIDQFYDIVWNAPKITDGGYDILSGQMRSGDDYSISEPINEKNIFITLNGIKKIESFFHIDNINDPANEQIEKGIREAICRKERKRKNSDQEAASKVKDLIDAIGTVTYTEECKKKISAARLAFSNLTVPQRLLVPADRLRKAEAEYEALKKKSKSNRPAKSGNIKEDYKKRIVIAMAINVIFAMVLAIILFNQTLFDFFVSHSWIALIFSILLYSISNGIADVKKWNGRVDQDFKWWDVDRKWSVIGLIGVFLTYIPILITIFSGWQTLGQIPWWNKTGNLILLGAVFVGLFLQNINEFGNIGEYWLEKDYSKKIRVMPYILGAIITFLFSFGVGSRIPKVLNSVYTGDIITLGEYEQDGNLNNGSEALIWSVHEIKEGKALLLCDTCIAAMPFNKDGSDNSWTNSDIRNWLDEEFYDSAFSDDEAAIISETSIVTGRLSDEEEHTYGETYGEDEMTSDRVFAPDLSEFWQITSELNVSEKAKAEFVANNIYWGSSNYQTMFWTRCPYGENKNYACGYDTEGERSMGYIFSPDTYAFVRPALYIDVSLYSDYISQTNASKLQVTARLKGTKEWDEVVQANVGDEVEFQIEYENLLNEAVENVMIRDILPTNIQYIEGTTYLFNSNYEDGVLLVDDTVTTSGINIGSYSASGNAYVRFTGKIVNSTLVAGDNQLVNWANVTVADLVYKDDVSVMVSVSE